MTATAQKSTIRIILPRLKEGDPDAATIVRAKDVIEHAISRTGLRNYVELQFEESEAGPDQSSGEQKSQESPTDSHVLPEGRNAFVPDS